MKAVLTINISEGSDSVAVSYVGSLDLTGLSYKRAVDINTEMAPHAGFILNAPDGKLADEYYSPKAVNLPYFGEGAKGEGSVFLSGDEGTGSVVGLGANQVFVPKDYRSLEHISGKSVYDDATFESLNLRRGIYTASLPNDIVVLIVGSGLTSQAPAQDPDPEPDPDSDSEPEPDPEPGLDPEPDPEPVGGNVIVNGEFESDLAPWSFYTNGKGQSSAKGPGYGGTSRAVAIEIITAGSNIQLYQNDISLQPNTTYELSFYAYSNTGRNMRVSLGKHGSPYTNYGLNREVVDLGTGWQLHTLQFKTMRFNSPVENGRLYFWFARDARSGDHYFIDSIKLSALE